MQVCLQHQNSHSEINNNLTSQAVSLDNEQGLEARCEFSEKVEQAKEKIIKQLPNMYRNTRALQYLLQNHHAPYTVEYKKIKGLILNIQKRFMWYTNCEEEGKLQVILRSALSWDAKQDLSQEDKLKYFFDYYAKIIFEH